MKVREVMTRSVVTARTDTPFREAVGLLLGADVGGLPVLDGDGHLIGIVTEADLISKEAFPTSPRRRLLGLLADAFAGGRSSWVGKAAGTNVEQVMTTRVITASPDDDVHAVARRMLDHRVKRVPVVDEDGRLVGIISRHDVLGVFQRSDAELRQAVEDLLSRSLYVTPDHEVDVRVRGGVVTLDGTVLYESDVDAIQAIVRRIDGVVTVVSRLAYREPDPHGARVEALV